jgi:glutamyl-Q tRNA(Asp) synthetase
LPASYRGRFAPSPTGPLHFGSLVAAVASYADARAADGAWLVRIEDVDVPRTVPGAAEAILASLQAHGFAWDEPVVRQSQRGARYEAALAALAAQGLVYACACTRRELQDAPLCHGERVYPGTCREGVPAHAAGRGQRSLRARVPDEPIVFVDRVQGLQRQHLVREAGDFVVRRADGWFAYQLAVVVDDADAGITHVVRGADLLASTPRQIWLQRALCLPTPAYLHVPVAADAHGHKLSKQNAARALAGNPVRALLDAWRFLGQPAPLAAPASTGEFWAHAFVAWSPARVASVHARPAPSPHV